MLSFFLGGVMGCGEQVTNCYYFIQSSFALHSLHFELSRISLIISSDFLLYHILLRQSSITVHVHVWRSTHLLFMISWCTFHDREGFARRVPLSSIMIRCNKGLKNHKLKYGKGEENLSSSILKDFLLLNASKKNALWQYHLHVNSVKGYTKMTRRPPFLPIYSHEAHIWKGYNFSMEYTRKGYLLSKIVYIRVRDWTSGRSLSQQSFIE